MSLDTQLINARDAESLNYWCSQFNCTEGMLLDALDRTDASVESVARHLNPRVHEEQY
jgi:hypothetical protein